MNVIDVTLVRVYTLEGSAAINPVLDYLHKEAKVRGVTVFRAVNGFGDSGIQHTTSFMDLSFSLPLVIEFFDHPDKINLVLEKLSTMIKSEHIVFIKSQSNA